MLRLPFIKKQALLRSQAAVVKWCSKSPLFRKQVDTDISDIFNVHPILSCFSPQVVVFKTQLQQEGREKADGESQ